MKKELASLFIKNFASFFRKEATRGGEICLSNTHTHTIRGAGPFFGESGIRARTSKKSKPLLTKPLYPDTAV
jgi:hypothetical protein